MTQLLPIAPDIPQPLVMLSVVRNPVAGDVQDHWFPAAMSLAEMVLAVPLLADAFHRHGSVTLHKTRRDGGETVSVVPRKYWARHHNTGHNTGHTGARLWVSGPETRIILWAPAFGGGAKGKNVIAMVAALSLAAVGSAVSGGALAPFLGSAFKAGALGARGLALATTFLGRLAISKLAKPAAAAKDGGAGQPVLGQAGASGNTMEPGGSGWRVAGPLKVFPPMASYPLVELVGDDELVEATYMLAGPHRLRDIRIENTPIGQVPDVQYQEHDGLGLSPSLVTRYGKQAQPAAELTAHRRNPDTPPNLGDQINPEASLPRPVTWTSARDPDRIWLQLLWPTGLTDAANNEGVVMPLRLTLQISGTDTIIKLPELLFHSSQSVKFSKLIELTWDEPPSPIADQAFQNGAWYAIHSVPAQTASPAGVGGWQADASFVGGAQIYQCARVERKKDRFVIYLDPAVFPRGHSWQVSMLRGAIFKNITLGSYSLSGVVYSFFDYYLSGATARTAYTYTKSVVESCVLLRAASVWDRTPLPLGGDATLQIRGRNINVTQVSVEAAGLVKSWNGTSFDGLEPSSNPADWLYHVRTSPDFSAEVIPDIHQDIPALAAWHAANVAEGNTIAGVFDGREWNETQDAICAAGFAKATRGRLYGVVRERNSAGEDVRQVFSPKNASGFRMNKLFAPVPDAIRVSFRDKTHNWDETTLLVIRPGLTAGEVRTVHAMDAVFLDDPVQVKRHFELNLATAWHRDHVFTFTTFFSGLCAEEGDIIGINHLMLQALHASARITAVTRNSLDEITSVTLDRWLGDEGTADMEDVFDLAAVENLALAGVRLGAAIADGLGAVTTHSLAGVTAATRVAAFDVPFVNPTIKPGQLVVIGEHGAEYLRCEITQIAPQGWNRFAITCVPEAPERWTPA